MSDNKKEIKKYKCPMCFMQDNDCSMLSYDEKDEEYYCRRCAFAAKQDEVKEIYDFYTKRRYKERLKPHPFLEK